MTDEKKKAGIKDEEVVELNLEELDKVTGGSIKNVKYTETTEISDDTKRKI
jgi:hypothetical protein